MAAVITAAMNQAFFTLSLGVAAMEIFGSYMGKDCTLAGEGAKICALDTFVAIMSGLIIFPACFSYGVEVGAGPSLIFITLPNIFAKMSGGALWGSLFFLFLTFAAVSTIIAVFENLIVFNMELFGWNRKKSVVVCAVLVVILSIPCVLGFNVLSGFQPFGDGSNIMDLEDFIVSNNFLPLGSLGYLLFCTRKNGWGWDNFIAEVNAGTGMKFPKCLKNYVAYGIPAIIIVIYLKGYYDKFAGLGTAALAGWMIVALVLLGFVFYCATAKKKVKQ